MRGYVYQKVLGGKLGVLVGIERWPLDLHGYPTVVMMTRGRGNERCMMGVLTRRCWRRMEVVGVSGARSQAG